MWHAQHKWEMHTKCLSENHAEYLGLGGKIIFEWILRKWGGGGGSVGRMNLAQDKDRWWALVNTVMYLWVPRKAGNFWTS
jgi:hypothetical protein